MCWLVSLCLLISSINICYAIYLVDKRLTESVQDLQAKYLIISAKLLTLNMEKEGEK